MRRCAHIKAQAWNPSQWSIENGCIFPSNQRTGPQRMCWLPGLCHPVSAWAPTVNPPPDSPNPFTDPTAPQKKSLKQKHGWGRWRWMIPHSGKHCLSKCVLLANTPHAWPHDWLIIFKTTASDLQFQRNRASAHSVELFSLAELSFLSVRQKVTHVLCIAQSCWSGPSALHYSLWLDL